ncbi:MAG: hypothetical protein ACK5AN_15700 [Planctomyces sp.]
MSLQVNSEPVGEPELPLSSDENHMDDPNWLTDNEKQAIIKFHYEHPLEGYRRLTWIMLDANVVACSPETVCNATKSLATTA